MQRSSSSNQAATVGGIVLVALGVLFLAQQSLGFDIGHYGWPLFIVLPGLAMLAAFALGPRSAAGMAIPGCVVTTVGLILAVDNTFDVWQSWAYAWTLFPAAAGIGLRLQGERLEQPNVIAAGTRLIEGGLLSFIVFATFFELILDLSHFGFSALRGTLGPALLIIVGLYLLMRRRSSASSGA
jgi:hypothetical protein